MIDFLGTIGDMSDGESLSGQDNESILDPSKKHKRIIRKTARARTVLSEKQLNILKTCYSANPRPDALMKEQLVEMTGLSPRVIRVWFQNKRCKDKKRSILMKQMQQEKVWEVRQNRRFLQFFFFITSNAFFLV